jgi:hypothetical protein
MASFQEEVQGRIGARARADRAAGRTRGPGAGRDCRKPRAVVRARARVPVQAAACGATTIRHHDAPASQASATRQRRDSGYRCRM